MKQNDTRKHGKKASEPARDDAKALIAAIQGGDTDAFAALCRLYAPLIERMIRQFAPSMGVTNTTIGPGGIGFEELRQDASMALYKAAMRYDPDDPKKGKNVTFGLYAKICIRNAMITALRRVGREKRKWERQRAKLLEIPPEHTEDSIPKAALREFRMILSPFEYTVFALYITGKPPREISEDVGKSEKSVSNAIYRSKTKIKGMLAKK